MPNPRFSSMAAFTLLPILFAGCSSEVDGDARLGDAPLDPAAGSANLVTAGQGAGGETAGNPVADTNLGAGVGSATGQAGDATAGQTGVAAGAASMGEAGTSAIAGAANPAAAGQAGGEVAGMGESAGRATGGAPGEMAGASQGGAGVLDEQSEQGGDVATAAGAMSAGSGAMPDDSGSAEPGTPSSGCSAAPAETGSALDRTLTVGTRERTYRLSVPDDYVPGEPLPMMFGLNGVGGDGKGAQSSFRLETGHRAIYVYPDSIYKESSGTVDWEYGGTGYDVDFFDALIAELTASYCVDMDRIFAVGVSAGGIMANMLGCFRGDVLRGIAPSSAMTWSNRCTGSVAVMVFCGEQDTFNPCDTDGKGETDFWTAENSCQMQTTQSPIADICQSFEGCAEDPVLICQHSGGHMWPTGGSDMAWEFFMGL